MSYRIQCACFSTFVWLIAAISTVCAADTDALYQTSFEQDAASWQATGTAAVSNISRRPGANSLMIRQWSDDERDAVWLSPAIDVTAGTPLRISFWAADNYLRCGDFSYSACMDAVSYDDDGKVVHQSNYLATIVWDDSRKSEMWGVLLPEGLVWKYHEVIYRPRSGNVRLKFHWPKPLLRGDCYLTDVRVAADAAAGATEVATGDSSVPSDLDNPLKLEISTPVTGNIYPEHVPLRFEVLLYGPAAESLPNDVSNASLVYEVTDFQHFPIASGNMSFADAAPLADKAFTESRFGKPRHHHFHQAMVVDDTPAREPGREFFLCVRLIDADGRELAHDTIPYMVASAHDVAPANYDRTHFAAGRFRKHYALAGDDYHDLAISRKLGVVWDQVYNYWWSRVQPHVPGPMDFGKPRPAVPRLTFCPNIEQERTYPEWIKKFCPPEVIIDDPLRAGKLTFEIDPYVEYIVAWIRHNRDAVARVVPSGLERAIDARTIELHRKAYAAIKAEFPDLPVGFMLYGLTANPSADVDIFLDNKLYECTDFIDTHIYSSAVDWTEWERLRAAYRKMGRAVPPLYSTEFAKVGGTDQVERSRNIIASHLDAFAHGMTHIYYFNQANETGFLDDPILRGPTDLGGDQTSGFLFMQQLTRPRVSPLIEPHDPGQRWALGGWGNEYGGHSLVPTLSTATYHNFVRNFDLTTHRETVRPTSSSIAYVFDRDDRTVAALWLTNPTGHQTFLVRTETALRVEDLFGRDTQLQPIDGRVLLTVDENPITLIFDQRVSDLAFEPVDVETSRLRVPRGGHGEAVFTLPAGFAADQTLAVDATVNGQWPNVHRELTVQSDEQTRVDLPISVDASQAVGQYSLLATLTVKGSAVGVLRCALDVEELLYVAAEGTPMTGKHDPAIVVTVNSLLDAPSRGVVRMVDRWFSPGYTARTLERRYEVAPRGSAQLRFDIPRELVNLTTAYPFEIELTDDSGMTLTREVELHFRGASRANAPINIDADLSDWALDELVGTPFARTFTVWGKPHEGDADCSGLIYSRWDEEHLYFAAVVRDQSFVQRFNNVDMWQDDNIMFGLYPWGWQVGEALHSGYYREHLGPCADGEARIFRVGNVTGGPVTAEGATIAARYEDGQLIYEWAYPADAIYPFQPVPGQRFRVSVFPMDRDTPAPPEGEKWPLGGVQLGGFNANVNARPEKWREFVLVE